MKVEPNLEGSPPSLLAPSGSDMVEAESNAIPIVTSPLPDPLHQDAQVLQTSHAL